MEDVCFFFFDCRWLPDASPFITRSVRRCQPTVAGLSTARFASRRSTAFLPRLRLHCPVGHLLLPDARPRRLWPENQFDSEHIVNRPNTLCLRTFRLLPLLSTRSIHPSHQSAQSNAVSISDHNSVDFRFGFFTFPLDRNAFRIDALSKGSRAIPCIARINNSCTSAEAVWGFGLHRKHISRHCGE